LNGIVAFEIEIEGIDGKYKLSQNRTAADRAGVIAQLSRSEDPSLIEMAAIMREREGRVRGQ
jgi:transcriptional regulator